MMWRGGCFGNEKPAHAVSISAFQMGKYEVTFDEWDACEQAKVCPHAKDEGWGRGKRPVINVSWNDITQKYIPWLNQQTGRVYRLPTEAEWEYAAQGGKDTAFPWGDKITCDDANYGKYSNECKTDKTKSVGSYAANGYGLYDTSGNVWEWVENCYQDNYQGAAPDGAARDNCKAGVKRVIRGGSWFDRGRNCRSARRGAHDPGYHGLSIGFRLARGL